MSSATGEIDDKAASQASIAGSATKPGEKAATAKAKAAEIKEATQLYNARKQAAFTLSYYFEQLEKLAFREKDKSFGYKMIDWDAKEHANYIKTKNLFTTYYEAQLLKDELMFELSPAVHDAINAMADTTAKLGVVAKEKTASKQDKEKYKTALAMMKDAIKFVGSGKLGDLAKKYSDDQFDEIQGQITDADVSFKDVVATQKFVEKVLNRNAALSRSPWQMLKLLASRLAHKLLPVKAAKEAVADEFIQWMGTQGLKVNDENWVEEAVAKAEKMARVHSFVEQLRDGRVVIRGKEMGVKEIGVAFMKGQLQELEADEFDLDVIRKGKPAKTEHFNLCAPAADAKLKTKAEKGTAKSHERSESLKRVIRAEVEPPKPGMREQLQEGLKAAKEKFKQKPKKA